MVFTTKAKQIAFWLEPLLSLPPVPTAKWGPLSPGVPYAAGLRPCVVQPSSTSTVAEVLLRGKDLNPRPPGYEPGELPNCSTARYLIEILSDGGRVTALRGGLPPHI
jgi:hypothetical protein